jgi:beta-xylosidase
MAPDASRLLGEGEIVFSQPERHPTLEGPKLYKRNGWYYILAPAGGVPRGWQVALRSRHIYGPYEDRIVLAQGRTTINGPHQGALVDTPDGRQWWFIHFQDAGLYGRVVHLNPVTWQDDWPLMGVPGVSAAGGAAGAAGTTGAAGTAGSSPREPVLRYAKPAVPGSPIAIATPQTSDELDGGLPGRDGQLSPQWQWHANHGSDWYDLRARPGWLRLSARPLPAGGLGAAANLLLQKLPARTFTAETSVALRAGDSARMLAGLIVVGESYGALVVQPDPAGSGGQRVSLRIDDRSAFEAPVAPGPVRLSVTMADGGGCRFGFAAGGAALSLIEVTFAAKPGRWVGAQVGLFAATDGVTTAGAGAAGAAGAGAADFDYFRFATSSSGAGASTRSVSSPAPDAASAGGW